MRSQIKRGFGFGLTSGIITTLGVMIGLYSSTASKMVVLGGILAVAIADAFSDALGMHISEEASSTKSKEKNIWGATISTFIFKFLFAGIFIIPILLLELQTAVIVSAVIGLILLGVFSYWVAGQRKTNKALTILEHVGIAVVVIVLTYIVGGWVGGFG